MTAGFQITQATINQQAGNCVVALRAALLQIVEFQTWLAGVGAAGLESTYSFSSGDAATLVSAFNDLNDMNTIYNGNTSIHLTNTYNYTQFAKQLTAYS